MFRKLNLKSNNTFYFILFSTLVCTAIFIAEHINDRFNLNDFKVYYSAAKALTEGKQVYGLPFGLDSGYYKYSPFTLLLFVPYTLFDFEVARVLHFILLTVCAISAIVLLQRIVNRYFYEVKGKKALLFLVFICILNHLFRELHLGNINVILVLAVTLAVYFSLNSKALPAGCLLGLIVVTKPYFLILVLPILAYRKKEELLALVLSVAVFLIAPALLLGFEGNLLLHQEWVKSMLDHGSYLSSYNTVEYLISRYIYPVGQGSLQFYIIALAGLLYGLFFLWSSKAGKETEGLLQFRERNFMISVFILTAIIPNLVITDTEHFLLSLPLIVFLMSYLYTKKNYFLSFGFAALIFFYGGNSSDLLGKKLSTQFNESGVLGLSNLAIIAAVAYIYCKESGKWSLSRDRKAARYAAPVIK